MSSNVGLCVFASVTTCLFFSCVSVSIKRQRRLKAGGRDSFTYMRSIRFLLFFGCLALVVQSIGFVMHG